jgi:hypothetical protein
MGDEMMSRLLNLDVVVFARLICDIQDKVNLNTISSLMSVSLPSLDCLLKRARLVWNQAHKYPEMYLEAGGAWYNSEVSSVDYSEFEGRSFTELIKEILELRAKLNKLEDNVRKLYVCCL